MPADAEAVYGKLDTLPRTALGHVPTPLEQAPRLSTLNRGARIWVKRDDCTGLAFGGNKVRQLEYHLGAALAADADTIVITGAVQSNFARLAAAAARVNGLDIHIQLEQRVDRSDDGYLYSGNVLLDRLLGATIHNFPEGEDEAGADANVNAIAGQLRDQGRRPYVIPLGPGHAPLGALGYVRCARELAAQLSDQDAHPDAIVVPSGSGATHAGLLFGLRLAGIATPVTGICVRRTAVAQADRIADTCARIALLLDVPNPVAPGDIALDDGFLAPGYGILNGPAKRAIRDAARAEALILDPVYSGKAMAGALSLARDLTPEKSIVFVHTGGAPALFAYGPDIIDD